MGLLDMFRKAHKEEHAEIDRRLGALEMRTDELTMAMRRLEIDSEAFVQRATEHIEQAEE